jgi:hypothetical protein
MAMGKTIIPYSFEAANTGNFEGEFVIVKLYTNETIRSRSFPEKQFWLQQ